MGLYREYILPELIQLACSNKRFEDKRRGVLPEASGHVLEVGIGSGLNLPFYDHTRVQHITALEPSARLRNKASKVAERIAIPVKLSANGAEDIPLETASVDTVVSTFTLCSIADIEQSLAEMRRVLKANGTLIFCEHGRAPEAHIQAWQDRINPLWKRLAGGCNLNRDIDALLRDCGFAVYDSEYRYMQGPRTLSYIYQGIARLA